jgi:hypothetical protein
MILAFLLTKTKGSALQTQRVFGVLQAQFRARVTPKKTPRSFHQAFSLAQLRLFEDSAASF